MATAYRYQTPDIYFERITRERARVGSLEAVDIDTTAFIGFTTRGPVARATRITSWRSFEAMFGGFSDDYLLPSSVFGFFANGGREAVIVRCAQMEGEQAATSSSLTLRDLYGRPTLKVNAKDPGAWGRGIKVRVAAGTRPSKTGVVGKLERGATEARVRLTRGFEPGSVVRIQSGPRSEYVTIQEIERKTIRWSAKQALRANYEEATCEGVELQLTVTSPFGFEIHDNLVFTAGHPRYLVDVINQKSNSIHVEDLGSRTPVPFNLPVAEMEEALQGGSDGANEVSPEDFIGRNMGLGRRTGLLALEDLEEVGMICAPDIQTAMDSGAFTEREAEAVQHAIVTYCERQKTAIAMLDVPRGFDIDEARDWRSHFDSKYACMFYPWYRVQSTIGGTGNGATRLVPSSGHIAGLTSHVDNGEGVHRAAANLPLKNVLGLERDLPKDFLDLLAPEGINCTRSFRGRGIRPWGARTLSSDKQWVHVNVRRLFIMIERSIAEGCAWAVFEGNDPGTWKAVERQISHFLYKQWKKGALVGGVPEDAFYVVCDERLNPPEVRDAGEFYCDIGLAAVRPAEFIVFRIGQLARDVITEEPVS